MGTKLTESDMVSKKYNMLTPLKLVSSEPRLGNSKRYGYKHIVKYRCDCGNEKNISYADVRTGHTKSCGCLARDMTIKRSYKHGHTTGNKLSPTWGSWSSMIDRCYTKSTTKYASYGGSGITVCDRWREKDGFSNFLADMGERPDGCTLDRIDGSKGYYPDNCRWATPLMQANNQKSNVKVNINGVDMNVSEAMRHYGIYTKSGVYYARLQRGWTVDDTFNTPIKKKEK